MSKFDIVTTDWLERKKFEHGLTYADIVKDTTIDKATISNLFSGRKALTKIHRIFFTTTLNRSNEKEDTQDCF